MQHMLANQPDFFTQKCMIQEIIETKGHKVIFYPKLYCKLNFIEIYWGAAKRYSRNNCDYIYMEWFKRSGSCCIRFNSYITN